VATAVATEAVAAETDQARRRAAMAPEAATRALEGPAVSAAMQPGEALAMAPGLREALGAIREALGLARPMAAQRQAASLATRRKALVPMLVLVGYQAPARLAAGMRSAAGLARLEARAR
jgi:hypothetical protein